MREVWGRMDTRICMAESLCYSRKAIKTLLISYILIQNKKFFKKAIGVIPQLAEERKEKKKSHLIRFRKIHQVLSLFLSSWKWSATIF